MHLRPSMARYLRQSLAVHGRSSLSIASPYPNATRRHSSGIRLSPRRIPSGAPLAVHDHWNPADETPRSEPAAAAPMRFQNPAVHGVIRWIAGRRGLASVCARSQRDASYGKKNECKNSNSRIGAHRHTSALRLNIAGCAISLFARLRMRLGLAPIWSCSMFWCHCEGRRSLWVRHVFGANELIEFLAG